MGGDDDDKPRPSPEMNQRMGAVLKGQGNDVCADCPAKRPLWVSFLAGRVEKDRKMGVMICTKCAQYHHFELGEKRCLIKYLKMAHEFSMADIVILENSGNIHVNKIFEAKLTKDDFDKEHVEEDEEEEQARRSKFIKNKYKKCKYQDEVAYYQQMLALVNPQPEPEPEPEPDPEPEPEPTDADIRRDLRVANKQHRDNALRNFNRSKSHDDEDGRFRREGAPMRRSKSNDYGGRPGGARDDHRHHGRHNRHDNEMRSSSPHPDRRDRRDRDDRMSSSDHRDRDKRDRDDRMSSSEFRDRDRNRPSSREKDRRKDFTRAKSSSFDRTRPSGERENRRMGLNKAKSSYGLDGSDKGAPSARDRRMGLSKAKSSFGLGGDRRGDLRGGRRPPADKDRKSDFRSSAPERPSLSDKDIDALLGESSSNNAEDPSSEFKHGRRMGLAADKDRKGAFRSSAPTRVSDTDLESPGKSDAHRDESPSKDAENSSSSEIKHGRRMGLAADKDRNSAFRSSAPNRASDTLPELESLGKSSSEKTSDAPSSARHGRREGLIKAKSSFGLGGGDRGAPLSPRDRRKGLNKAKSSFGLGGNRRGDMRGGRKSPADKDRKSDFRSSAPEPPSFLDKDIDALLDESSGKNNGADKDRDSSLRSSAPERISEADILGKSQEQVEKNETNDDLQESSNNDKEDKPDKSERRDSDASLGEAADAFMPMPPSRSRSFNLGQSTSSLSLDPHELTRRKSRCKSWNTSDSKLGELLSEIGSEGKPEKLDSFGFPTSFAEGDNIFRDKDSQEKPDVASPENKPSEPTPEKASPDESCPEIPSPNQPSPPGTPTSNQNGLSEEKEPSLSDLGYEEPNGESLGGTKTLHSSFHGTTQAAPEETMRSKSMDLRATNIESQGKPTGKPESSDRRKQMHKSRSVRRNKSPQRKRSSGSQLDRSQTLPEKNETVKKGLERSLTDSDKKLGRRNRSFSPVPTPGDSPPNSPNRRRLRKQMSSRRAPKQKSSEGASEELKVDGEASTEEGATPEKSTNDSEIDPDSMIKTSVPKSSTRKPISLSDSAPFEIGDLKGLLDESVASNDPMWTDDNGEDSQQRRSLHDSAPTLGSNTESGDNAKPKRAPRRRIKKTSSPDAAAPNEVDKSSSHSSSKKIRSPRTKKKTVGEELRSPKSPRRHKSLEGPKSPGKKKAALGTLLDADKKEEDVAITAPKSPGNRGSPRGGRRGLVRSLSHESLLENNDEPIEKLSRNLHSLVDVDSSQISDAAEGNNAKSPANKRRPGVGPKDQDSKDKDKERRKSKEREKRNLHKSFAIGDGPNKAKSKRNLHASFAVNDRSKRNLGGLDNLPSGRKGRGGPKKKLVRSLSHESLLDAKDEPKDEVSRNLKSLI